MAHEYLGKSSEDRVRAEVGRIPDRLQDIFRQAEGGSEPTNVIADDLARDIVANGNKNRAIHDSTDNRRIA